MISWIAIITAFTFLLLSCGGGEGGRSDAPAGHGAAVGTMLTGELTTISVLGVRPHGGIIDMETNYVTRWMEERTNIHIDWTIVPMKDAGMKIERLFAADGPLPDAVFPGENSGIQPVRLMEFGARGVIVPIQDFIDRSAPNTRALFEKYPGSRDWVTMEDGNIYGFGDFGRCPHCMYSQKFWINSSWLETLDLPHPRTPDEFHETMKTFRDSDPNGNGRADEIPLAGGSDKRGGGAHWNVNIDGFLMNPFVYNDGRDRIVVEDGSIYPAYTTPGWRAGLAFLRTLFSEGLMDRESFVQGSERVRSLVEGETVLLGAAPAGIPAFFSNPTGERTRDYVPLAPLAGPEGKRRTARYPSMGIEPNAGFVITRDADDPELIVRWVDFGLGWEANLTRLRGEMGVDWRYAETGEIGINGKPAVWKDKMAIDIEGPQNKTWHGFPVAEWGEEQGLGLVADPSNPWEIEGRLYRATLLYSAFGPATTADLLRIPAPRSGEYERLRTTINEYVETWIVRFVTGAAGLDVSWDEYIAGLSALGLEHYLDIVRDAVERKYGRAFTIKYTSRN